MDNLRNFFNKEKKKSPEGIGIVRDVDINPIDSESIFKSKKMGPDTVNKIAHQVEINSERIQHQIDNVISDVEEILYQIKTRPNLFRISYGKWNYGATSLDIRDTTDYGNLEIGSPSLDPLEISLLTQFIILQTLKVPSDLEFRQYKNPSPDQLMKTYHENKKAVLRTLLSKDKKLTGPDLEKRLQIIEEVVTGLIIGKSAGLEPVKIIETDPDGEELSSYHHSVQTSRGGSAKPTRPFTKRQDAQLRRVVASHINSGKLKHGQNDYWKSPTAITQLREMLGQNVPKTESENELVTKNDLIGKKRTHHDSYSDDQIDSNSSEGDVNQFVASKKG